MSIYNVQCPVFAESGGFCVTSPFGWRVHPISGRGDGHKGTDITRWTGYSNIATITAFASGTVVAVKDTVPGIDTANLANSAGNYVVIDHGGGWVTKYFHLRHGSVAVRPGDCVHTGESIGSMGTTGNSTGAHLHFQIEKDGTPVDGLPFLLGEKKIEREGDSMPKEETKRQDSEPQAWAKEAVEWAVRNSVIYGDGSGDLKLREPCTREQMLVFLYRALRAVNAL